MANSQTLDTPPKPAAMRSAELWYGELVSLARGEKFQSSDKLHDCIKRIQLEALASAKTDGVAVVRQLRDALHEISKYDLFSQDKRRTYTGKMMMEALAAATAFLKENGG